MNVDPTKNTDRANVTLQFMVAVAVLVCVGYCLFALTHLELKDKNNSAFLIILGAVLGWGGALVGFSFPGTVGSAKQTDTINKLASNPPTTTTTTVETSLTDPEKTA
jgi:hypothetical protein